MNHTLRNFLANPAVQQAMAADVARHVARRANPRAMVGTPGRPHYGEQVVYPNPMAGSGGGGGAPQSAQLHGTPVPQGAQLHGTPVPQGAQLHGTPVPQGAQLHGTPVPRADQLYVPPGTPPPGPGVLTAPGAPPTHAGLQCKEGTTPATGPWGPFCRNITTNVCPPGSYPCGQTDTGTSTEVICCVGSHPQGGAQLAAPTPTPWPPRPRRRPKRNPWMPNGY